MSHSLRVTGYYFSSGPGLVHIINHGLNQILPVVYVYLSGTLEQVIPAEVIVLDSDSVQITTYTSISIFGRIV